MYNHPGERPRFLSLTAFKFPLNALFSAAHRISGLALVVSLLGYLALTNLILLHPTVSLHTVHAHWIVRLLHSLFWLSLSFHWLTGLRHLLAEHFIQPLSYQRINSDFVSYSLLSLWIIMAFFIIKQAWS